MLCCFVCADEDAKCNEIEEDNPRIKGNYSRVRCTKQNAALEGTADKDYKSPPDCIGNKRFHSSLPGFMGANGTG